MKFRGVGLVLVTILVAVGAATSANAVTPFMLKDILADSGSSMGKVLHSDGTTVYFFANNGTSSGLWKTDGTANGTVLLKAGLTGGDVSFPVKGMVSGELLFDSGNDLWKTNGSAAGTVLVKEFQTIGVGDISSSVVVGNTLLFVADGDNGSGAELWKSNGTTAGTVMVKDINPGSSMSLPRYFAVMGGEAYFAARTNTEGVELWKSDGTTAGTVMVRDISTVGDGSSPQYLTAVGTQVYFTAEYSFYGRELWVTDGTSGGTTMVEDINTSGDSNPYLLTAVGTALYFAAQDGIRGYELWKSDDGTGANTDIVADIRAGGEYSHSMAWGTTPEQTMAVMGGDLYFRAFDATDNDELWKTGPGGTVEVAEINLSTGSDPEYFAVVGETLYFAADDGSSGVELWMTQGTAGTTSRVADINSGSAGSNPRMMTAGASRIFFAATDGSLGSEPWVLHDETVEPDDPTTVGSSSHTASTWSNSNLITVQWSGASDSESGVRGYSVLFDTSPSTVPDRTVDVFHTSNPHEFTSAALTDGTSHYFHVSTCDWADNCTSTEHLGPFWIETQPPTGPSALASTSHTVDVWSTQTTLAMQWSGAGDAGSGMQGYSVLFDTNATTSPDTTVDVAHGTDPHTTSDTLPGGTYWFHLRACDNAGTCSAAQHSGPYKIDVSAPSNPSSLTSTSHTVSEFSNDPSITMAWSGAGDASGSGVAGYSVLIDETSNTQIDTSTEVAHIDGTSVHSWTSSDLSNGNSYYFHLRTCDAAGACSATVHRGPFMIDVSPPTDPSEVSSSSHETGTWSNDADVEVSWSGATGAPWGASLDGYKVKFNTSATGWDTGTEHWVDHLAAHTYTETLAEGPGHYFHLKTCDGAGNCTSTVHLGPFNLDLTSPSAPSTFESTSHETGVWSDDNQIDLEWSGAVDTGGSGLAGYSVACDSSATGAPDTSVDVAHTSDPHSFTSSPLADGSDWYCHIRSCDTAGSCGDPIHLGPFSLEQTAPSNPTVESTTHEPMYWSSIDQIEMQWQGATDGGSGLTGYSFEFSTSSDTVPDTTVDQAHGTDPHTTTSAVLADGASHYFHLRTCDEAGICSSAVHLGPYKIDTQDPTAPTVTPSSHTPDEWSSNPAVNLSWSAATDVAGGSGVAGYSFLFDTSTDTQPDSEIDQHTQHGWTTYWETSDPLDDGTNHWFHLRTLDGAGNSAVTQHLGPFKIDTRAPDTGSANVHSTSHTVGETSGDSTIDVEWNTATDSGSGLSGYFGTFRTGSSPYCNSTPNLDASTTGFTSSPLDNGSWYFDLCAIDEVSNRSSVTTVGPFVISAEADLTIGVTDSPDPVEPGDTLTYTVTLTNNGPSTATQFEFELVPPEGLTPVSISLGPEICNFYNDPWIANCFWMEDEILSGESKQISIVTTVDESATGPLVATATATGWGPPDPNTSNDTAQASSAFPEFDNADISVSATAYPDPANPGANLTYTVTVSNEGPTWSEDVFFFHDLPPDTTFISSVPGEPVCTTDVPWCEDGAECFICDFGTMAPSETQVVTLTLGVDPAFDDDWIFAYFGEETDDTDPDHANNNFELQVAVGPGPEVPFLPCEVRPFDDTNEGSLGTSLADNPREYCTRLFVPLTDGPYDCRWDGGFFVTDIGTRWTGPAGPTTAGFLIRSDSGDGDPGPVAGETFLSDVPSTPSWPDGEYVFSGRHASSNSNRTALGSATGYEVWACHQTVGVLAQGLATTGDFTSGTTSTPCRTSVSSGPFVDCRDTTPLLEAIGISARFAGIAGVGDGSQVVPAAASASSAAFRAFLHSGTPILRVEIEHDVVNPTAIHLHAGVDGENGPILFQFPELSSPIVVDAIQLTAEELLALGEEGLYIDVHSETHPDGDVRGQLVPAGVAGLFSDGFESGDTSGWSVSVGN